MRIYICALFMAFSIAASDTVHSWKYTHCKANATQETNRVVHYTTQALYYTGLGALRTVQYSGKAVAGIYHNTPSSVLALLAIGGVGYYAQKMWKPSVNTVYQVLENIPVIGSWFSVYNRSEHVEKEKKKLKEENRDLKKLSQRQERLLLSSRKCIADQNTQDEKMNALSRQVSQMQAQLSEVKQQNSETHSQNFATQQQLSQMQKQLDACPTKTDINSVHTKLQSIDEKADKKNSLLNKIGRFFIF